MNEMLRPHLQQPRRWSGV